MLGRGAATRVATDASRGSTSYLRASVANNSFISFTFSGYLAATSCVQSLVKSLGFVAYHGIETDEGGWASVSSFETPRRGEEEANRVAAKFVKNNKDLARSYNPTRSCRGSVVAHKAK